MFNYEDILAQMKSGTSAEDIAKAFTDSLNKALKTQEEEAKKAEQEAKCLAQRKEDAEAIGKAIAAYMTKYHGMEVASMTGDEVMGVLDTVAGLDVKFKDLGNGVAMTMKGIDKSIDKIFDNFFKKYGI